MKQVLIKWLSGKNENVIQSRSVPDKHKAGEIVLCSASKNRFIILQEIRK